LSDNAAQRVRPLVEVWQWVTVGSRQPLHASDVPVLLTGLCVGCSERAAAYAGA
jgi:hypothetical protein